MERQMCFLILSVLLLTVLNSALAQTKPSGVELGAALTLRPTFSGSITGIVWKLNGDLVAEWLNNEFEYYGTFRDRTTLDPATGELVVKNVAVADAGLYTVEINSNVQSQKYQAEVMKKVPKPTVLFRPLTCNSCSLACHGETKDAGTVTYSWKEDDGEWKEGKESRDIMNDPVIRKIRTFSCRMKNAISVNESEPHENPFFQEKHLIWPEDSRLWVKVLAAVMRSLAIVALLGTVVYFLGQKRGKIRKVICPCRCGKGDDNAALSG
ncbi:uncharacterized protein LOC108872876 [Lates calcarifer]|uniref:Uncharacterized protein LOC108872876 n=1 Tax=Lates calcarifer TaxID=8187 RepID=A0A4W6BYX2_LATCA|nr:uncharacterized protein LOC108872876 [Lates calcarifer]